MHVLLDNDCLIRAYQSFVAIFQIYFLSCLINAFSDLQYYVQNYAGVIGWYLLLYDCVMLQLDKFVTN